MEDKIMCRWCGGETDNEGWERCLILLGLVDYPYYYVGDKVVHFSQERFDEEYQCECLKEDM